MKLWLALDILESIAPCYARNEDAWETHIDKKYLDELQALKLVTPVRGGSAVKRTELGETTVHVYKDKAVRDKTDMDIDLADSIPKKKTKCKGVKSISGYKFNNMKNDLDNLCKKLAEKRIILGGIDPEILERMDNFCDAVMLIEDAANMDD